MILTVRNLTFLLSCALASGSPEYDIVDEMEAARLLFYGRPCLRMDNLTGNIILTLFLSLVTIAIVAYLKHCPEFNK